MRGDRLWVCASEFKTRNKRGMPSALVSFSQLPQVWHAVHRYLVGIDAGPLFGPVEGSASAVMQGFIETTCLFMGRKPFCV